MNADLDAPFLLRMAKRADAAQIALVWESAWHDGHRGHAPVALVAARDAAYFRQRARDLLPHITLADELGQVLGVVIVVEDELQQLMVSESARGRGVGGLLLGAAERRVAEHGHGEIWLAVVPGNSTARRFYEARGWLDSGDETYESTTLAGHTVSVRVRRYVKDLRSPW